MLQGKIFVSQRPLNARIVRHFIELATEFLVINEVRISYFTNDLVGDIHPIARREQL